MYIKDEIFTILYIIHVEIKVHDSFYPALSTMKPYIILFPRNRKRCCVIDRLNRCSNHLCPLTIKIPKLAFDCQLQIVTFSQSQGCLCKRVSLFNHRPIKAATARDVFAITCRGPPWIILP